MSTLAELLAQQASLSRKIDELRSESRTRAIQEIHQILAEHGLTLEDVAASSVKAPGQGKNAGKKVAPKYRNAESGQTWTGRGLKPKWLTDAIAAGRPQEDFLI